MSYTTVVVYNGSCSKALFLFKFKFLSQIQYNIYIYIHIIITFHFKVEVLERFPPGAGESDTELVRELQVTRFDIHFYFAHKMFYITYLTKNW